MRVWLSVALASACACVVLVSTAGGSTAPRSETKSVPGTAQTHNGVLLETLFEKGKKYTLKVSGEVVVDPYNPRTWDAVYCFQSTNGTPCQPTPYAVCGLQLTWYRGTEYSHWTVFGCPGAGVAPLPYKGKHVYTQTIVPPFDARLKVGIGDSVPQDNTGSFEVTVTGPPPEPVSSCKVKNDWGYDDNGNVVKNTKVVRRSLKIIVSGKEPCPAKATVAAGATVTICNEDPFKVAFFSFSKHNRWNLPRDITPYGAAYQAALEKVPRVPSGGCSRVTVRNPTGAPLDMKIFDDNHSQFKITLRIEPE